MLLKSLHEVTGIGKPALHSHFRHAQIAAAKQASAELGKHMVNVTLEALRNTIILRNTPICYTQIGDFLIVIFTRQQRPGQHHSRHTRHGLRCLPKTLMMPLQHH